jgi:hypothetical protein
VRRLLLVLVLAIGAGALCACSSHSPNAYEQGDVTAPPRLLSCPPKPAGTVVAPRSTWVRLSFVIDEMGRVQRVRASANESRAASDARLWVRNCIYEPARIGNAAVSVNWHRRVGWPIRTAYTRRQEELPPEIPQIPKPPTPPPPAPTPPRS